MAKDKPTETAPEKSVATIDTPNATLTVEGRTDERSETVTIHPAKALPDYFAPFFEKGVARSLADATLADLVEALGGEIKPEEGGSAE